MKAKVPKCASLAFQASTSQGYDPSLKLQGDTIPFIGDSAFRFLGAPITIHDATADRRGALLLKLEDMLKKVNDTLLTRQQKLHLYSCGICSRLIWDMTITNLSITWVTKNLEAMATRFLKRWSGLARNAATHRLYLPKTSGGLHLPSISSIFKKTRCALAASQMCSQDATVRLIASRKTTAEEMSTRVAFKPHQEVVEVMRDDPGASRRQIVRRVKARVTAPMRQGWRPDASEMRDGAQTGAFTQQWVNRVPCWARRSMCGVETVGVSRPRKSWRCWSSMTNRMLGKADMCVGFR